MSNKTLSLEQVLQIMKSDGGYIVVEAQNVVYARTANDPKPVCTISDTDLKQLYEDGVIQHVGDGFCELTDKAKEK